MALRVTQMSDSNEGESRKEGMVVRDIVAVHLLRVQN